MTAGWNRVRQLLSLIGAHPIPPRHHLSQTCCHLFQPWHQVQTTNPPRSGTTADTFYIGNQLQKPLRLCRVITVRTRPILLPPLLGPGPGLASRPLVQRLPGKNLLNPTKRIPSVPSSTIQTSSAGLPTPFVQIPGTCTDLRALQGRQRLVAMNRILIGERMRSVSSSLTSTPLMVLPKSSLSARNPSIATLLFSLIVSTTSSDSVEAKSSGTISPLAFEAQLSSGTQPSWETSKSSLYVPPLRTPIRSTPSIVGRWPSSGVGTPLHQSPCKTSCRLDTL